MFTLACVVFCADAFIISLILLLSSTQSFDLTNNIMSNSQYYSGNGAQFYTGEVAPRLSASRSRSGEVVRLSASRSRSGEVVKKLSASRSRSGELVPPKVPASRSVSFDEEAEADTINKDRWDEGGRSDCGYSDAVHDTLMSVGQWMHGIVGDPNEEVETNMKGIGSYFQEASYAVRDYRRGTLEKEEFKFKTDNLDLDEEDDGTDDEGY